MTIVNLMPAHRQAPVALWLLARDFDASAKKIAATGAEAVLLPAGHELAARLSDALGDSVRVVECNPELGFVYANPSAAAKVLSGEKPIPSCANGEGADSVIEGGALLSKEGSRWVWPEGASEPVCLDATTTVAQLVAAAGEGFPLVFQRRLHLCHPGDLLYLFFTRDRQRGEPSPRCRTTPY